MSTEANNTDKNNALVAFRPAKSAVEYQVIIDPDADTVWATEQQIADIFDRDRTVIGRHIRNTFKDGELNQGSVSAKFAHTAEDGKTYQNFLFLSDCNVGNTWNVLVNTITGDVWIEVSYPDMSGDALPCEK